MAVKTCGWLVPGMLVALCPAAPAAAAQAGPGPGAAVRIMALGDSITRGVGAPGLDSYRTALARQLTVDGLNADFVGSQSDGAGPDREHEGHGGFDLGELAAQAEEWLTAAEPDVILLHAGTNNVTKGDDAATMLDELGRLIDRIRSVRPAAYLFLAQLSVSRSPGEARVDRAFNALLPGFLARRLDERVVLVDQSDVHGIDLHDTRHPNKFGYEKMAWNWYRALAGVFELPGGAGPDPYQMTRSYRCLIEPVTVDGVRAERTRCRTWVLRDLPDGAREWQTLLSVVVPVDGEPTTVRYWAGADEVLT